MILTVPTVGRCVGRLEGPRVGVFVGDLVRLRLGFLRLSTSPSAPRASKPTVGDAAFQSDAGIDISSSRSDQRSKIKT